MDTSGGNSGKQGFRDLIVWQRAMTLVTGVYDVTRGWPREEQFGLTSQIRRAAVSVPSNIAEGRGRFGPREFLHHLSIAFGSLCEIETQLLIAERLAYSDPSTVRSLLDQTTEVRRLLRGLMRSLRDPSNQSSPHPTLSPK